MVYIYNASLWCDDCGEKIKRKLIGDGSVPTDADSRMMDSDDYPQWHNDDSESDSPDHCQAAEDCENAIDLIHYGAPSSDKIGARVDGGLTEHGVSYLLDMIEQGKDRPSRSNGALHRYWTEEYADYIPPEKCGLCQEEPQGTLRDATDESGENVRVCWLCEDEPGITLIPEEHKGQTKAF